eukprot:TRINITY_DN818_c0_g1_i2.p1 TRINITY_DN818_c0_g1~~TRINITY_DN818_c0_g1_i2.p1  ORF type:complete len:256 (-),score=64.87 TRINITY_DN818_c0_g1_i2:93-860(-)
MCIRDSNKTAATNACGVLCTLTVGSQRARSAVSSSPNIIENIEKALGSKGNLPHNAALLVSILSTVASFRLAFVKSKGLKHLMVLLNRSTDPGEQCNVLYALVTLAEAGRDCHSELYDSLVQSGVIWKTRQLMCSDHVHVQANATALAEQLRPMPQALTLARMGSSDAVHALALLSCDNRPANDQITPTRKTKPLDQWSPTNISKRRRPVDVAIPQRPEKRRGFQEVEEPEVGDGGLSALAVSYTHLTLPTIYSV